MHHLHSTGGGTAVHLVVEEHLQAFWRELGELYSAAEPLSETSPEIQAGARRLAQHFVVMARAAALVTLGERDAGADTIQAWVRFQRDQRAEA